MTLSRLRRVPVPLFDLCPELLRAVQPQPQRPGHQSLQDGGRRARRRGQPRGLQNICTHTGGEGGVDQIHQVRVLTHVTRGWTPGAGRGWFQDSQAPACCTSAPSPPGGRSPG